MPFRMPKKGTRNQAFVSGDVWREWDARVPLIVRKKTAEALQLRGIAQWDTRSRSGRVRTQHKSASPLPRRQDAMLIAA